MNKNSIFENISTRRSIRAFTQQPIAKADLETIVQAGAWAPTAMNRQAVYSLNRHKIENLFATYFTIYFLGDFFI